MANGSISDNEVARWLNLFRGSAIWASAHTSVPSWSDPGASEVFDAGYARQRVYWSTPASREITTTTAISFAAVTAMSLEAVGYWTAQTGGTMLGYSTPDPDDVVVITGPQTITIPIGELSVRVS